MLSFGIEIECILPQGNTPSSAAQAIDAAGVPCYYAGYSHQIERNRWKIVSDASLRGNRPGDVPCEIVAPPLTDATIGQVETVCGVLGAIGARVNRSCGLHVHIDACTLSVAALKRLAVLYIEHEHLIDQLLPPSRRGSENSYLKTVRNANLSRLARATDVSQIGAAVSNNERYVKLNYTSFWRHGTVEFRHHSGTVDAQKIIRWVNFCQKLVETAVREQNEEIPLRTTSTVTNGVAEYWRRGRRTRAIYALLTRPEGVTAEEAREALSVRARPNIRWHLRQAGVPVTVFGRRNGLHIFRLEAVVTAPASPEGQVVVTFDTFFAKLQLSVEEVNFWRERVAMLTPEEGPMPAVSNTMRRAGV